MAWLLGQVGKRRFGNKPKENRRLRTLRLERLEPRVVLSIWLSGNDNRGSMDQGAQALQQRLDDASRLLAAQFSETAPQTVELPTPRLQQLPTSDVYALHKTIVAGDPNALPPDSPANRVDPNTPDSRFAGVGSLRVTSTYDRFLCTATAISPTHLLTAAHCLDIDDNGSIDVEPANVEFNVNLDSATSSTYVIPAAALFVHPDWTGFDNPRVNDDVAVIELASELPADVPFYALHTLPFLDNEIPTLVGYGESGTGVSGYSVNGSYFTKRSGKNEAEYYFADDEGTSAREVFYYDFDAPASSKSLGNDIETTLGGGDSGGPAFLEDANGNLTVFGVNTFTLQWRDDTPAAPLFGSAGGGMVVYEYIDFISSIVDGDGIFVTPTLGSTEVVEGGATDTYTLAIQKAPADTVVIDVIADAQLSVSPSQITFTSENWSTPQSVVVSAVNDTVAEGPHRGKITHTSTSNDPAYNGNNIDEVRVRILDDDWSLATTPYVDLGTSDNVAWDQPRVAVEVLTDAAGNGSVGPTIFNTWLLDTGANSTMAFATAVDDMDDLPHIYQTVGKFEEFGVAGPQIFDISAPYRFDFAGSNGNRQTLLDTSLLSDALNDISILGPWGIVGMSAMTDRVTTFDFGVWTDIDIYDLYMGLDFSNEVSPGNGNGGNGNGGNGYGGNGNGGNRNRYSVAVDNRITWTPEEQIIEGTQAPVWADVPFLNAIAVHNNEAAGGNFLYDSGAQMSVLSTIIAKEIGLDSNGDGTLNEFDANFARYEVVGGIGGTVAAPVFLFDEIRVPTEQGADLVWTDLQWLVLDIVDGLDGVFGFDLMTSGWIEAFPVNGKSGYIMQTQLDYRDWSTLGTGTIHLDLNPENSQLIDPNGPGAMIIESGGSTTVSEIGVDDTYQIMLTQQPTADVTITLVNTENQLVAVDDADPSRDFLVFTPENWDVLQTVRVSAVDDEAEEIFHRSSILHVSSSTDPVYDAVGIQRVIVNIIDNDYPGLMLIPSDGATEVVEGGITDTYQVVLTFRPTADVTVDLEHLQGQVTAVDANSAQRNTFLQFTPLDWDVPQTVLVTALEDAIEEGYHETYITHQLSTNDAAYQETFSVQELVSIWDPTGIPIVTVDSLATDDSTPELTGTVDNSLATVEIVVNGNTYTAINHGDGTWTLPDDTISPPLAANIYDIQAVATDPDQNVGLDATSEELLIILNTPTDIVLSNSQVNENTDTSAADYGIGTLSAVDDDPFDIHTFELIDGAGDSDNTLFRIAVDQLKLKQGTVLDYETQSAYSIRIAVTDAMGNRFEKAVSVGVTDLVEVDSVVINDGSNSRSVVKQVVITLDDAIEFDPGAFEINRRGTGGGPVDVTAALETFGTYSLVTLTFSGTFTTPGDSLTDGNYDLRIIGSKIRSLSSGLELDGAKDGSAGGDHLFGDQLTDKFFCYFGDTDGDRDVDGSDFGRFGLTFRKRVGFDGFNSHLDYDGDGDVDGSDFGQFGSRFRKHLIFE